MGRSGVRKTTKKKTATANVNAQREKKARRLLGDEFLKKAQPSSVPKPQLDSLAKVSHGDPHTILGVHRVEQNGHPATAFRAFLPESEAASVILQKGKTEQRIEMKRVHEAGIYEAVIPAQQKKKPVYQFEIKGKDGQQHRVDDPYRFPVSISEMDLWLFNEGNLDNLASFAGAHEKTLDGVKGYNFVLWAPNAQRVSIVGDFNGWDGRQHMLRKLGDSGVWEGFVPNLPEGHLYKFEIKDSHGNVRLKSDPCAQRTQLRPETASITPSSKTYPWKDAKWMAQRAKVDFKNAPMSTYEVHLPSWSRKPDGGFLSYRQLADKLVPYLKEHNFTHVELMGLMEHPLDASWGYQVTGYYAPTSRHGSPEDFKYFVDQLHKAGLGVLVDWVPAHFPKDDHALGKFDGTNLYDHKDDRLGAHKDWGTRIFNYGRSEVQAFLTGSLVHLLKEYHVDGTRVDAVASMLYRDYSRKKGEWIPNKHGGNENLEAIDYLKKVNSRVGAKFPGVLRVAEESTAFPGVTKTANDGGLGFDLKWNMGWMNDTLKFFEKDPIHRSFALDNLTNTFLWAHAERYVCALSHDEVVYGKNSLLEKMPGDDWQKFANLRLLFGYMWSYPGHKLLFMGQEFGQRPEWDFQKGLDWDALKNDRHKGTSRLIADLNKLYQTEPALHERQFEGDAMEMVVRDKENSVVGVLRKGQDRKDNVMFLHNMTPVPREKYRVGVDRPGSYREILNTDAEIYGGSNTGNLGAVKAEEKPFHGKPYSIEITVPPLATVAFKPA